ncbi:RNA-binding (RRM/RBD/RNP motifs) family protein [Wolffia australiana]
MGRDGDLEAFKSLFSLDNPFRRKPATDSSSTHLAELQSAVSRSPESSSRRAIDHGVGPGEYPEEAPAKTKRKKPISSVIPLKEDKKQRKDGEIPGKKKKKRKRDELEIEYEKRNLGSSEENGSSAVVAVGRKRKGSEGGNDVKPVDSFDDESKLLRTVFVGNLPLKTKRKALVKEFSGFGEVESIRLRSVPILDTKVPRKGAIIKGQVNESVDSMNAYIVFKEEQSARAALAHNMSKFLGNHIRVDIACPPRKKMKTETPLYNIKRTIFVGNLPFDIKDEEVYAFFCEDSLLGSQVEAVRVVRDPQTSLGKGIAYVLLKTREAANTAVKRKNWTLRDRSLRICHARSDPSPSNKPTTPQKRRIIDHSIRKTSKTSSEASPSSSSHKPSKSGALSYQGLRASSKRGGVEKKARRSSFLPPRSNPTASAAAQTSDSWKMKKTKRPAVAARKAKDLREQSKKRKQEPITTMTSDLAPPRKKPRHVS